MDKGKLINLIYSYAKAVLHDDARKEDIRVAVMSEVDELDARFDELSKMCDELDAEVHRRQEMSKEGDAIYAELACDKCDTLAPRGECVACDVKTEMANEEYEAEMLEYLSDPMLKNGETGI